MRAAERTRASWLDRALGTVGLQRAAPPTKRGTGRRVFHAATIDRLTTDLFAQTLSANDELKGDLNRLRGLSRRLSRDTAYGARYPKLIGEQVLGADGIRLQCRIEKRIGGLNQGVNAKTEDAWKRWGKRGVCTVDGRQSWIEFCYSVVETMAVDGEVLVRKVRGAPNAFGFAVQLIDVDLLDEKYTGRHTNGNEVIMGVEVDKWQRPVAYHLFDRHPSEYQPDRKRQRISASEIEHLFIARRGAVRGTPWSSAILLDASTLGAFLEASVHAARIGASRMAAIERDKDVEIDDEDEEKFSETPDEVAPGQFLNLAPGERMNSIDWQYPTGEIDPFTRIIVRSLSAGWNVSYSSLSGDLSQANFSSIRAGTLQERDFYRRLQRLLIDGLCTPVYEAWRDFAILAGEIPSRANLTDYDRVVWQVRGWPWVDPKKDVESQVLAVDNLLTTRRRILGEQGLDFEEVVEGLAEENAMLKRLGLSVTKSPAKPPDKSDESEEKDDDDDDESADASQRHSTIQRVA